MQLGSWQCGYATIVLAAHIAEMLGGGNDPSAIVGSETALLKFIGDMLIKSMQNRAVARIAHRWHWFYER
jgi:hypothetical protein